MGNTTSRIYGKLSRSWTSASCSAENFENTNGESDEDDDDDDDERENDNWTHHGSAPSILAFCRSFVSSSVFVEHQSHLSKYLLPTPFFFPAEQFIFVSLQALSPPVCDRVLNLLFHCPFFFPLPPARAVSESVICGSVRLHSARLSVFRRRR